jgi:hypothetical protein
MLQQTTTTKTTNATDPKIASAKAALDRLEEHESELKAEFAKWDQAFKRTPSQESHAGRAIAEQLWVNATEATSTKRAELETLLAAERKAERQRRLQELFAQVDPVTQVAPHTARATKLIRTFVADFTATMNALAGGAELYNATLPQLNALGGGGAPISLGPELVAIQKAIADLDSNDFARTVRLLWNNSTPPFWKIEIAIPGDRVHGGVRP